MVRRELLLRSAALLDALEILWLIGLFTSYRNMSTNSPALSRCSHSTCKRSIALRSLSSSLCGIRSLRQCRRCFRCIVVQVDVIQRLYIHFSHFLHQREYRPLIDCALSPPLSVARRVPSSNHLVLFPLAPSHATSSTSTTDIRLSHPLQTLNHYTLQRRPRSSCVLLLCFGQNNSFFGGSSNGLVGSSGVVGEAS